MFDAVVLFGTVAFEEQNRNSCDILLLLDDMIFIMFEALQQPIRENQAMFVLSLGMEWMQ